jgi:hypothetical protein
MKLAGHVKMKSMCLPLHNHKDVVSFVPFFLCCGSGSGRVCILVFRNYLYTSFKLFVQKVAKINLSWAPISDPDVWESQMWTKIVRIHSTVFSNCRWVDLSQCSRLTVLQPHAFPPILRLHTLSLASTALTSLPADAVPARRLLLDGLRLACTCQQLAWLVVVVAEDDVMRGGGVSGAVCLGPGRLAGRAIESLTAADLDCSRGDGGGSPSVAQLGGGDSAHGELVLIVGIVVAGALITSLGLFSMYSKIMYCIGLIPDSDPFFK